MHERTRKVEARRADGALRLAAALLAAAAVAGCSLERFNRPEDAFPLAVHHGLAEVVVVGTGEGPVFVTGGIQGWDGHAPAALHAALREGVAAEARALGLGTVTTAADTAGLAVAPPPRPPAAAWGGDVVAPAVPVTRRPAPPPGVAWVEVRLVRADLDWVAGDDGSAILSARFEAQATTTARRDPRDGPRAPTVARRAFTLRDPEPRAGAAWGAEGGAPVKAGLERLVALAARRVAADLLATASDGTHGTTSEGCGPAPRLDGPDRAGPRAARSDGQAWARWEAWTPGLPRGATAEIGYDLRAWRLEPTGQAVPVLDAADLSQVAARLSPPGGPAATYAWSVRGVARLADGRQVRSRWSQPRLGLDHCASEPDPWLAHRAEADGRRARATAAPAGGPSVEVAYRPVTWEVRREGLGPDLNAGTGAGQGLVYGLGGGLKASFACGPFFPICAVIAVPAGGAVGLTAGLVVGGVSSAVRATSRTESSALAPEPLRGALLAALAREAHDPALLASLRAAAAEGLADEAAGLAVEALELQLIGHSGADHPARVQLVVAGALRRGGAPPVARRVDVVTPSTADALDLAADGALALTLVVRAQGVEAGRRLAAALLAPDPPPEPRQEPAPSPEPAREPGL